MKQKLIINGQEIPGAEFVLSEGVFDNKLTDVFTCTVRTPRPIEETQRLEHQLEALRWLQGKTSDEFVLAWIQIHKESLERAGGTPERS